MKLRSHCESLFYFYLGDEQSHCTYCLSAAEVPFSPLTLAQNAHRLCLRKYGLLSRLDSWVNSGIFCHWKVIWGKAGTGKTANQSSGEKPSQQEACLLTTQRETDSTAVTKPGSLVEETRKRGRQTAGQSVQVTSQWGFGGGQTDTSGAGGPRSLFRAGTKSYGWHPVQEVSLVKLSWFITTSWLSTAKKNTLLVSALGFIWYSSSSCYPGD